VVLFSGESTLKRPLSILDDVDQAKRHKEKNQKFPNVILWRKNNRTATDPCSVLEVSLEAYDATLGGNLRLVRPQLWG